MEPTIKFILTILFFFFFAFGGLIFYWVKLKYPKIPYIMLFFIILVYGFLCFLVSSISFIILKIFFKTIWKFLPS